VELASDIRPKLAENVETHARGESIARTPVDSPNDQIAVARSASTVGDAHRGERPTLSPPAATRSSSASRLLPLLRALHLLCLLRMQLLRLLLVPLLHLLCFCWRSVLSR
jgi:hypothetical protein